MPWNTVRPTPLRPGRISLSGKNWLWLWAWRADAAHSTSAATAMHLRNRILKAYLNKSTISLRERELLRQASSGKPCAVVLFQPLRKIPCGFAGRHLNDIADPQLRLPTDGTFLGAGPDFE